MCEEWKISGGHGNSEIPVNERTEISANKDGLLC